MLLSAARIRHDDADPEAWHCHDGGQLSLLRQGVLSIATANGRLWSPPGHLAWIPPGLRHASQRHGPIDGLSLHFSAAACSRYAGRCAGHDLRRAGAGHHAARVGFRRAAKRPRAQAAGNFAGEVAESPPLRLTLPQPSDPRLRRIAAALTQAPDDARSRDAWAQWAGLSGRNLSRLFPQETGLSFQAWRRRLRLLSSLELLSAGQPVGVAAWRCGYGSPSAFIAAFRQDFGCTPPSCWPGGHLQR